MSPVRELLALSPRLHIWHAYDSRVKAELFSSALGTDDGLYFVDPIPLHSETLANFVSSRAVAGIIVTNANHFRAAASFSDTLQAPLMASAVATSPGAELSEVMDLKEGDRCGSELRVLEIAGAVSGEIAIFCERDGGTMIVGDALIHFEPYGFEFLPAKYCTDAKEMKRSLRHLLDYRFERMLFAHGTPLIESAHARLAQLLRRDE
jgi:glyoxylase-like metal-dependent hydrolase (beta-lactamase superfamily II)